MDSDIDRELSSHIQQCIDDLMASGMTEEEARRTASRRFGNYQQYKERTRDMDIHLFMESLAKDARYSIRGLRKITQHTVDAEPKWRMPSRTLLSGQKAHGR